MVKSICDAAQAPFTLDYGIGTASVYNDPALVQKIMQTIERVLGGKEFVRQIPPDTGGEDFSDFARLTPSVILWLGVCPAGTKIAVHSPTFVADEQSIPIGVRLMSAIILDYIGAGKQGTVSGSRSRP